MQPESSRQIRIVVWRGGLESRLERGTFFDRISLEESHNGEIGRGCVRGTAADLRAWSEAGAAYGDAIRSAGRPYGRVVDSEWRRLLPGYARRVERARQTYRQATEAARVAYQPVIDEIGRREEAALVERQQEDQERRRFHEQALADGRERDRRRKALAERPIWGWSAVDPTTVRVFESVEQGLTASELDEELRGMYESGVRTVEWDPAARAAAARACALPGLRPSDFDFRQWWMSAARVWWADPSEIPPPRRPGGRGIRNQATAHHSARPRTPTRGRRRRSPAAVEDGITAAGPHHFADAVVIP